MASRRLKLTAIASVAALGMVGYFLHFVFAVQGQGVLAQAPLNNQVQVPPAFIMAVDDSGSMTFETLFTPQDGTAFWNTGTASTNGYFNSDGSFRSSGTGSNHHLIPHSGDGYRIGTTRYAIPPIDNFGFARSPEYNPQYYNPATTYRPWLNADGTPYVNGDTDSEGNAVITRVRVDPRNAAPTIDFTQVREEADSAQLRFRVLNQTRLPAGTQYYATSSCGGLGATGATRNKWVTLSTQVTVTNNCIVGISYFPAVFYLKTNTPVPDDFVEANRIGPIAHAGGPNVSMYKYEIRPENYATTTAYQSAIRNFSNWYSYYGNRNRAMIASMSHALVSVNNMRVGYFTINQHASRANPVNNVNHRVTMYDMAPGSGERGSLYTQIFKLPASGGTPNRQAVEAMGKQFLRTDSGAPVQLACQKNAGMLFTDGYSNTNGPTVGNIDEDMGFPFADGHSNTLADIATQYYINNIRSDLDTGLVPVPQACSGSNPDPALDCNADPHMNFYGITLGATGASFGVTHFDVTEGYTNPPAWPSRTNDTRATIDDIWHATINTRGEYINAYTPDDVTNAMRRILSAVAAGSTPSGSIAMTGARIGSGSLSVEPFYAVQNEGTDWYSRLSAFKVESNPTTRVVTFVPAWEASAMLPGHDARTIHFGTGIGILPFQAENLEGFDALCNNPSPGMSRCHPASSHFGTGPNRLDVSLNEAVRYLRGDTSLEDQNGGRLRDRASRLGDIVNSTPVVSSPRDDYGYSSLLGFTEADNLASSYNTFLSEKRSTRNVMVYAGANDGMLHAFDGGMADDGVLNAGTGGRERFGFIPQSVLGHMGNLLFPYVAADGGDQKFQHRYYVDGPTTVSDAYYDGGWSTVLVGTTGAGSRGVFALDVSEASQSSATGGVAPNYLWEINSLNDSLPLLVRQNIGHVLGRPVVVPVRSGTDISWKAIFGNGFNSQSGRAVLFVVDIDKGPLSVRMIEANESGAPSGENGLGNIVVLDRYTGSAQNAPGRDGFADTVYAADQKGAIWKFNLADAANEVTVPLFVTQPLSTDTDYRQPIMGGLTAAAGPAGGVMLYFGTGSFSFVHDASDDSVQSLYGILDSGGGSTIALGNLLEQSITSVDAGQGVRTVSQNMMAAGRTGWYLNLPRGERFVGYPRVESGIVFMPTYAPTEADGCSTAGFNWLFGLNALSGAASLSQVSVGSPTGDSPGEGTGAVALDTGGTAPVRDVAVMTAPRVGTLSAGSDPDDLEDALAAQCSMVIQVAGAPPMYLPRACGRQSWRQLL